MIINLSRFFGISYTDDGAYKYEDGRFIKIDGYVTFKNGRYYFGDNPSDFDNTN